MQLFLLMVLMAIILSGCEVYSGWVRYPCQEYENWNNPECKPPACIPEGLCTKDLFDNDLWDEVTKYER